MRKYDYSNPKDVALKALRSVTHSNLRIVPSSDFGSGIDLKLQYEHKHELHATKTKTISIGTMLDSDVFPVNFKTKGRDFVTIKTEHDFTQALNAALREHSDEIARAKRNTDPWWVRFMQGMLSGTGDGI